MEGITLLARFAYSPANNPDCACPFKSKNIIDLEAEIKKNINTSKGNLYEYTNKISSNPLSFETAEAYIIGNQITQKNYELHHNYVVLKTLLDAPFLSENKTFKERASNCLIIPGIYNGNIVKNNSSRIVKNHFGLNLEKGDLVIIHYDSILTKISENQYNTLKEITEKIVENIPNTEWVMQHFPSLEKLQALQNA
jgi:hypothetical protein